jgi:hypothetical protein
MKFSLVRIIIRILEWFTLSMIFTVILLRMTKMADNTDNRRKYFKDDGVCRKRDLESLLPNP